MGGSQPSGNTTTTQNSAPWAAQQPYLQDLFKNAQNLYNSGGAQYYQGSTVAPYSATTNQGINMTAQRGLDGSASDAGASRLATDTMNGSYLNSNPYLDKMYDSAASAVTRNYQNAVQPGISSAFEASGRYGSGAQANAQSQAQLDLGQSLGNMASNIYGQNYASERNNQMQAMGFAPTLQSMDYNNLNHVLQAGGMQDQMNQAQLSDQVNRWNYNQNLPYQNLQRYQGLTGGNYGGTATTSQPYFQNKTAGALGGAMMGAQIGSLIPGIGTGIGAIGGGLLGMF